MGQSDDLGHPYVAARPVERIVSLVPSLSEAIAATRSGALVGVTDWCTHPADLDCARIRGTKNPDCAAIVALKPDVVIANMEENRKIDIDRLRKAGVPVWVTRIESIDDALLSLERMFSVALEWAQPKWLDDVKAAWSERSPAPIATVAVPIWRDPWMAVGSATFTGDLLERLGFVNALADSDSRYPKVELAELDNESVDLALLPDEPYAFSQSDGPEAFVNVPTVLVSGRLLTWYGPSLLAARTELSTPILEALSAHRSS